MATDSTTDVLRLIDEIVALSQENNVSEVLIRLQKLNQIQPHKRLSLFIQDADHLDLDQLTYFLRQEFSFIQPEKRSLEEVQKDYNQTQQSPESKVDSHDLNQLLKNQRAAAAKITELNRLRTSLKAGVEDAISHNASFTQAKTLLKSPQVQAILNDIVSHTGPQERLDNLTKTVTDALLNSTDHRISLLVRGLEQTALQNQLNQTVNADPAAAKAFSLLEGKDSNDIIEAIRDSTLTDAQKNNQPDIKQQLRSILAQTNIGNEKLEGIERFIVSSTNIDVKRATAAIETQLGSQTFANLPSETQHQLIDAFIVNFEAARQNQNIRDIQVALVSEGKTGDQLSPALAEAMYVDSYQESSSQPASSPLSLDQLQTIGRVIENPELLNDPTVLREFLVGPSHSTSFIEQWRPQFSPPPSGVAQGFSQTVRSWSSTAGSNFQVGLKHFFSDARTFLEPLGKAGTKINFGSLGGPLKSLGSSLGGFLKSTAPKLGQVLLSGAKALPALLAKAGTALIASAHIWVPIVVIGITVFLVFYPVIFPSSQTVARTNLTPVGGGQTNNTSNPYLSVIKTADPTTLSDPVGSINYTYSITAKQGALTNITITDELQIIKKNGNQQTNMSIPQPPTTIDSSWESPAFSYTLSSTDDDAIVTNTVTVTATAPDGSSQEVKAIASTIIGTPPTGCYLFAAPPAPNSAVGATTWASAAQAQETAAIATILAAFDNGSSLLCSGGPINLYLAASGCSINYGGWNLGGGNIAIDYKFGSIGDTTNALYTLAHESGHVYDERTGISASTFRQSGLVSWDGNRCVGNIYPFPQYLTSAGACYSENFAEGFARHINPAAKGNLPTDWQAWFQTNVF